MKMCIRDSLQQCRWKCRATLEALDDEKAAQPYVFPWGGEMPFAELMLYTCLLYTSRCV